MRALYLINGPLRWEAPVRHAHGLKRFKFSGRLRSPVDSAKIIAGPARTRFAPSPTGYLHIGSLRTALYNYLLAKATGGQFLLRIEDTDQNRIVPDAESRLFEDLRWTGLGWDEGPDVGGRCGPYRQSERLALYAQHAQQLLSEGRAYRCFCSPEDLDQMKALNIQDGSSISYNGTCSHISPSESERRAANGEPHCVRFKCHDHTFSIVEDLAYGKYKKPGNEDDFIIIKRDGFPTYHLANVVDDHLMEITHVIRGAEWLVSTPRHVALYDAFGWDHPQFAHVGLLVNREKQKLSKRHGDVDITSWKDRGALPIALLNYVMLLGWSHGRGEKGQSKEVEVMNLEEMISKFHLKFTKGDIVVNDKFQYLQKAHIRRLRIGQGPDSEAFVDRFLPGLEASARQCEEERLNQIEGKEAASGRLGTALGPLVTLAHANIGEDNGRISRDYLKKVLLLDATAYEGPVTYLKRTKYAVWQVPEAEYRDSLTNALLEINGFFLRQKPSDNSSTGDNQTPPTHSYHVFELVDTLRQHLEAIEERDWTKKTIEASVMPLIRSIYAQPRGRKEPREWGFHLLRWVMAALSPGPALIPSIELLGRQETLRRVDEAFDIAKSIESA